MSAIAGADFAGQRCSRACVVKLFLTLTPGLRVSLHTAVFALDPYHAEFTPFDLVHVSDHHDQSQFGSISLGLVVGPFSMLVFAYKKSVQS